MAQLPPVDARSLPTLSLGPDLSRPWKFIPSIVIMSASDDPRLPVAYEVIAFWNSVLANLGSSFRLGQVRHTVENIPKSELRSKGFPALDRISGIHGDIFVTLSDLRYSSFTTYSVWDWKALVVIGSDLAYVAPRPNGPQNMIAHELGHAIGLGHNSEAAALMCGGAARCSSKAAANNGFLPLTRGDRLRLLEMYPPDWQATEAPRE